MKDFVDIVFRMHYENIRHMRFTIYLLKQSYKHIAIYFCYTILMLLAIVLTAAQVYQIYQNVTNTHGWLAMYGWLVILVALLIFVAFTIKIGLDCIDDIKRMRMHIQHLKNEIYHYNNREENQKRTSFEDLIGEKKTTAI